MAKLNFLSSGYPDTTETITVPAGGGSPLRARVTLSHDLISATGLRVYRGETALSRALDYRLESADYDNIHDSYTGITFYSNFGQTLTVIYRPKGDYVEADDINSLDARTTALEEEIETPVTGMDARITTIEDDLNTVTTGVKDRLTALEAELDTETTGLLDRVEVLEEVAEDMSDLTVDVAETVPIISMPETARTATVRALTLKGTPLVNLAGNSTGYTEYDFDLIKRMNLDSDGTELAEFGDVDYATDGSNGEVVVRFPKYYMHVGEIETEGEPIVYMEVSATEADGFTIHPAFVSGGEVLDYVYIGAFEGSVQKISDSSWIEDASDGSDPIQIATLDLPDHMLRSVSGRKPKTNQTLPEFRTMAENRGTGWGIVDLKQAGMVNLLYLIKYADFNAQTTVGQGITGKASGTGNESEPTGATAALGAVDTGGTNLEAVSMFGLENWWGNIWEFTDGGGIKSDGFYVAPAKPYNNTLAGYTKIPCVLLTTNGYLKNFIWHPDALGLFLPKSVQTDSPSASKYVCDYLYAPASYATNCFLRGGTWYHGVSAGPFYWNLSYLFTSRTRYVGARACYVPQGK